MHVLGPWSRLLSLTVPWTHGLVWVTDQISVQVTILQKPVLECKTFLFPLSPFLIVKVDVSALKREALASSSLSACTHLFIFIVDNLGFLVPLKPHHVLSVEPPALLLKGLGCQVLGLGPLHIVEDEEQSFS